MCPYIDQLKKYVEIEEPKGIVEITFFLVINAEKGLTCLRDYHLKGLIFNKKAYERSNLKKTQKTKCLNFINIF